MRPTKDQWAIQLAQVTAQRATCCRRQVGCILLNELGHVIATGYNGVAAGLPHCNDRGKAEIQTLSDPRRGWSYPNACPGATSPSGTNLEGCEAIHAEQNALLQCRDVQAIHTCYVTASPCMTCVKLLLNTGCRRIVFVEAYPHTAAGDLWRRSGRTWEQIHQVEPPP